jgi:hypothetical protein
MPSAGRGNGKGSPWLDPGPAAELCIMRRDTSRNGVVLLFSVLSGGADNLEVDYTRTSTSTSPRSSSWQGQAVTSSSGWGVCQCCCTETCCWNWRGPADCGAGLGTIRSSVQRLQRGSSSQSVVTVGARSRTVWGRQQGTVEFQSIIHVNLCFIIYTLLISYTHCLWSDIEWRREARIDRRRTCSRSTANKELKDERRTTTQATTTRTEGDRRNRQAGRRRTESKKSPGRPKTRRTGKPGVSPNLVPRPSHCGMACGV